MKEVSPFLLTAVAAVALVGIGALVTRAPAVASATKAPVAALTVTVAQPERAEIPRSIAANGSIAAWQEAVIGAESAIGRLTRVNVQVGDKVRRGDVLAVANSDLAEAEMAQLEAAVEEAKAAHAEAAANARRARDVEGSGALSSQQVNQYLTAERTAAARLASQQAAVKAQALRVRNSTVLAPDDGVISSRSVTVGAIVPPGQEMFRLIRQGRLEWRAEVNGTDLPAIEPGQPAQVQLPGGEALVGKVRMLSPQVDPATRRGLVFVDLPEPGKARAGLFARGDLLLGSGAALTLPQAAVLLRDGFHWVYVVGADGKVRQTKVTVGRRSGERIEIAAGLPADARVVAGGAGFLTDGDTVRVVDTVAKASPK